MTTKVKEAAVPVSSRGFCLFVLNKSAIKMPQTTLQVFASKQSHQGCYADAGGTGAKLMMLKA